MARDLDMLIRDARGAEGPSDAERELVRRGLEQRLARGASDAGGLARGTSSGLAGGVVVAGALALVVLMAGVGVVLATRGASPVPLVAPSTAALPPQVVVAPMAASPPPNAAAAPERLIASEERPVASEERPVRVVVPTPAVASSSPVVRGMATHAAPRTPDATLAAESRALGDVQRALRDGAGERALKLLDEQDRRFVRGALAEERAAARVLGSCAAGRVAAAQQGAATFVAQHPSSPLRARVLAACAEPSAGAVTPAAGGRKP